MYDHFYDSVTKSVSDFLLFLITLTDRTVNGKNGPLSDNKYILKHLNETNTKWILNSQ